MMFSKLDLSMDKAPCGVEMHFYAYLSLTLERLDRATPVSFLLGFRSTSTAQRDEDDPSSTSLTPRALLS